MNWIQQHILIKLVRHSRRRYSELRPDGVEGNLFLYHLDGLIKDKLVEKVERQYQLTAVGLRRVATLSLVTGRMRQQPQVLTAVVCRNERGEFLLTRWRREPNTGLVSLPQGMVHYGETLVAMAATELAEKACLVADLAYKGVVSVRAYRGEMIDRHMLVHVFVGNEVRPGREEELRPDMTESFWAMGDDLGQRDFVPGFYELLQMVKAGDELDLAEISLQTETRIY
jgi:ADP-ribose pyrophosphatase YjhB (NUDIX family)